jgi:hypothetical protein
MLSALLMLSACASRAPQEAVHTAFRNSKPRSILVLPVNQISDINATNGMLSQMTMPLADGGYYVVPVAEMDETFRHNGLTTASDIQNVPPAKLREIFRADAALYTTVTNYGAKFVIVDSRTVVTANAKLVDLRSGDELWKGQTSANGKEIGYNFGVGGLTVPSQQAAIKACCKDRARRRLAPTRTSGRGDGRGGFYGSAYRLFRDRPFTQTTSAPRSSSNARNTER